MRGDVRMIQRGEDFRFALKPREPIGVSRERRRQDLDRDLAFQLGVGRPIHLPHPAFADLRGDFVDAEAGAGSEGQCLRDYTGAAAARTRLPYGSRKPSNCSWYAHAHVSSSSSPQVFYSNSEPQVAGHADVAALSWKRRLAQLRELLTAVTR